MNKLIIIEIGYKTFMNKGRVIEDIHLFSIKIDIKVETKIHNSSYNTFFTAIIRNHNRNLNCLY